MMSGRPYVTETAFATWAGM